MRDHAYNRLAECSDSNPLRYRFYMRYNKYNDPNNIHIKHNITYTMRVCIFICT